MAIDIDSEVIQAVKKSHYRRASSEHRVNPIMVTHSLEQDLFIRSLHRKNLASPLTKIASDAAKQKGKKADIVSTDDCEKSKTVEDLIKLTKKSAKN